MAARIYPDFVDTKSNNDTELIRNIINNDEAALALLYDRYKTNLFGLLFRILQNHSEAEDVLQEVFVQVWQQAKNFDAKRGKPYSWLISITHSRAIDRLRYLKSRTQTTEKLKIDNPVYTCSKIEQNLIFYKRHKLVRTALSQLPQNQRKLILMAYFEGYSQSEITKQTGIPLGTVKTRMRLGMNSLRDTLSVNSGDLL
jgi:RNA polymerase sigma-70 factor, ECF subfamily